MPSPPPPPPNSTIKILPCSDLDIETCFRVISQSFGHDAPFMDIYFPNHDTPAGRTTGANRLLEWKQSSPDSHFLKAVATNDVGGEEIIGLAVWTHMCCPPNPVLDEVEDVPGIWPDGGDAEYMRRLWRVYVVPRSQVIRKAGGGGVYVLELLAVHPDAQRRGAGSMLVNWGLKEADELKIEAVVEGTPAGVPCYLKCGFKTEIPKMNLDVGEGFQTRREPVLTFMRWKPTW